MQENPARLDANPNPGSDPDRRPSPRGTKRVRIDRGNDLALGRGSLLRTFFAWGAPPPPRRPERRAETRHERVECQAWVGWKTWRRFHTRDAVVINLSRGGAQVFLDGPPPTDRAVWVFLETPERNAIVKGRVREVRGVRSGQCAARVEFSEPCPFAFFEAAVCGLAPLHPRARPARTRLTAGGTRLA